MIQSIKNLKAQVELMLRIYPNTRDSDIELTLQIWRYYHPEVIIQTERGEAVLLKELFELEREDAVKRCRAAIQNDPKNPRYLPTSWEVAKQRKINEEVWRAAMSKH